MWAIVPGLATYILAWTKAYRDEYFKITLLTMIIFSVISEILFYAFPRENMKNVSPLGMPPSVVVTGPALYLEYFLFFITVIVLIDVFRFYRKAEDAVVKVKLLLFLGSSIIGFICVIIDSTLPIRLHVLLALNRILFVLAYFAIYMAFFTPSWIIEKIQGTTQET